MRPYVAHICAHMCSHPFDLWPGCVAVANEFANNFGVAVQFNGRSNVDNIVCGQKFILGFLKLYNSKYVRF